MLLCFPKLTTDFHEDGYEMGIEAGCLAFWLHVDIPRNVGSKKDGFPKAWCSTGRQYEHWGQSQVPLNVLQQMRLMSDYYYFAYLPYTVPLVDCSQ